MIDLLAWRKAKRITQAKAASLLAITESHYRKLETGRAPINRRIAFMIEHID